MRMGQFLLASGASLCMAKTCRPFSRSNPVVSLPSTPTSETEMTTNTIQSAATSSLSIADESTTRESTISATIELVSATTGQPTGTSILTSAINSDEATGVSSSTAAGGSSTTARPSSSSTVALPSCSTNDQCAPGQLCVLGKCILPGVSSSTAAGGTSESTESRSITMKDSATIAPIETSTEVPATTATAELVSTASTPATTAIIQESSTVSAAEPVISQPSGCDTAAFEDNGFLAEQGNDAMSHCADNCYFFTYYRVIGNICYCAVPREPIFVTDGPFNPTQLLPVPFPDPVQFCPTTESG